MKNEFEALANNSEWSEKAIEKYLVRRMEGEGGLCLKYVNANKSGYPDRICLYPNGEIAFVEVKGKTGKVSPLQKERIAQLQSLGFTAHVCRSKEDVDRLINYLYNPMFYGQLYHEFQTLPIPE